MSLRRQARRVTDAVERRLQGRRLSRAGSLAEAEALSGGRLSVHACHLGTGQTLSHGADQPCKLASIAKVPLAVHTLARAAAGAFALDELVAVEPRHVCPGSGVLAGRFRVPGVSLSVDNLLRLSLAQSDNTATDVLFDLVGGPQAVQAAMNARGIQDMRVDRTIRSLLGDLYGVRIEDEDDHRTVLRGATPSPAHAQAFTNDPRDTATPVAVVDLLAALWAGRLLPPDATDWLVSVLGACDTGGRRFRGRLPPGAVVAQKTGTLWGGAGRVVADAAVVRLHGGGHVALAAFLSGSQQPRLAQEAILARVAEVVVGALSEAGPGASGWLAVEG